MKPKKYTAVKDSDDDDDSDDNSEDDDNVDSGKLSSIFKRFVF